MTSSILVTDGEQRAALAVVRALGRAGHRVHVCSPRKHSLAGTSRYAAAHARTPDPLDDPRGFVKAVCALVERWSVRILVPISDASLMGLLPARSRMPGVLLPFPETSVYRQASDKRVVLDLARQLGIRVPEQLVVEDPTKCTAVANQVCWYPVVVKPARSVSVAGDVRIKRGVEYAADEASLLTTLRGIPAEAYPVLLQRRVVGSGLGVFLLMWNGQTLARFAHRRIREKPPEGGVSTYAESVVLDSTLFERSRELLLHLGWSGPAMVEYKDERDTGVPYLMEVNARFWGSLQLAIDAGVDFPSLLVRAALGEDPQPIDTYQVGVRTRWWWGDVDHLIARLRGHAPEGSRSRLRAVLAWLTAPGNNEVLRWEDPVPAVRETLDWLLRR